MKKQKKPLARANGHAKSFQLDRCVKRVGMLGTGSNSFIGQNVLIGQGSHGWFAKQNGLKKKAELAAFSGRTAFSSRILLYP